MRLPWVQEPFPILFENGKGRDDKTTYPTMDALTKDWNSISEKISKALNALTEDALGQKTPRPVPLGDSLGDFIAFIVHHEAYTIGQLGICRKFFGLEAMKYS